MNKVRTASGIGRLAAAFSNAGDRKLLSIYLTAGFPKLNDTARLIVRAAEAGADMIEIGMPYSDPLADGPTIQATSDRAIANGMTMDLLFEQVREARKETAIPIIWMGYLNPVIQYGPERFLDACLDAGIDGTIIPDLPPEVYDREFRSDFERRQLASVFLVTPLTSVARIRRMDELSSGFLYLVSTASLTGRNTGVSEDSASYLRRVSQLGLSSPTVVGFGIHDRDSFLAASRFSSGAIIGSAFLKAIDGETPGDAAEQFIRSVLLAD